MRFRKGDLCEWVYVTRPDMGLGETMVLAVRPEDIAQFGLMWDGSDHAYLCRDPDGEVYGAYFDQIRLKKPPSYVLGTESHLTAEDKREDRQKERV